MKLTNGRWNRIYNAVVVVANLNIPDFKANYAIGIRILTPLAEFKTAFDKTIRAMGSNQEELNRFLNEETELDVWTIKTSYLQKAPADKITPAVITDLRELIEDDAKILGQ